MQVIGAWFGVAKFGTLADLFYLRVKLQDYLRHLHVLPALYQRQRNLIKFLQQLAVTLFVYDLLLFDLCLILAEDRDETVLHVRVAQCEGVGTGL
jgi:hypothetical protein